MKSNTILNDVLALNIWVNLRSIINLVTTIFVCCLLIYVFVIPEINFDNIYLSSAILMVAFFSIAILTVLLGIPVMLLIVLANALFKGCLGEKFISTDENGIVEKNTKETVVVPWRKVKLLAYTPDHLFIQISRIKYIVISKRDFGNEYEFTKYFSELVRLCSGYS